MTGILSKHHTGPDSLSAFECSQMETSRFTAKEWDEETKLYYMSARYQYPMTSRWMSTDPAGAALVNPMRDGFSLTESLNWYSYCGNNPVNYTDPTGLDRENGGFHPGTSIPDTWLKPKPTLAEETPATTDDRVTDGSIPELPENGPCLMRAIQGVAETYAGINLTEGDMKDSITKLQSGKDPIVASDWEVQDSKAVLEDALTRLGVDVGSLDIDIFRPKDPGYKKASKNATASLLRVGTIDAPGTPGHWQEGDSQGNLVFDPISGSSGGCRQPYPKLNRIITINPRKED